MQRVIGVDVAAGAWVAVVLQDGAFADAAVGPALAPLLRELGPAAAVVVDIPIGLPGDGDVRACDAAARAQLGPRRSSLFPVPSAAVLGAPDFAAALAHARATTGRGLSQQSYALRHAIFEAAEVPGLREGHPELSFTTMAGAPCAASKRTWNGQRDRIARLRAQGIVLPDELDAGRVPADDLLDAAAVAWTAARVASRTAASYGDGPVIVA